jgi:hypothetical protein
VGQQQSSSEGSSFQQLLASATQNVTPAANSGQAAAKPETAKTPASTAATSKQGDSQASSASNEADVPAASTNNNAASAIQQSGEDTTTTTASDQAAAQVASQANASIPALLSQTSAPIVTLKTVLADVTGQATTSTDPTSTNVKTTSGTPAGRTAGKQDKPQAATTSNNVSVPVPVTILPADQAAAIAANFAIPQQGAQQSNNDAGKNAGGQTKSSGSAVTAASLDAAAIAQELPQAAATASTNSAQHAEAPVKQANPIITANGEVGAQASATAPANAGTQSQLSPAQVFTLPMSLPSASALPAQGNSTTAGSKTATKDSVVSTKTVDPATSTDAAKSSPTASSSDAATSSSASTPGSSQPVQHIQVDPAQVTAVTAKSGDATAPQPVAMHTISPDTATTHRAPEGAADAARSASATTDAAAAHAEVGDTAPASGINTARVLQSMGETEMHVGMRSTEFGDISIRTSISQQQMMAQISLDHGDLSQAIAAHVSTVQAKLSNEYGLHAHIEVSQQSSSFSGDSGQSAPGDQRAYKSSNFIDGVSLPSADTDTAMTAALPVSYGDNYRLDIRA